MSNDDNDTISQVNPADYGLDKFNTVEDLASAYKSLEKQFHTRSQQKVHSEGVSGGGDTKQHTITASGLSGDGGDYANTLIANGLDSKIADKFVGDMLKKFTTQSAKTISEETTKYLNSDDNIKFLRTYLDKRGKDILDIKKLAESGKLTLAEAKDMVSEGKYMHVKEAPNSINIERAETEKELTQEAAANRLRSLKLDRQSYDRDSKYYTVNRAEIAALEKKLGINKE